MHPTRAPLAIVTMTYNESQLLPVWLRHYTGQVPPGHCYVVDHGSDDGSTSGCAAAGVNLLRIPRSPQDDVRRSGFIAELCGGLLTWYDSVIYVDVDELLVADPARHRDLPGFASHLPADAVISAIGLDVVHCPDVEPALDWARPVSDQRRWVRFTSSMCKPVVIRRKVRWAPGFHNIDAEPVFGELFLFHLRYADLPYGLERLGRTRNQAWGSEQAGSHQRMPDDAWRDMLLGMAGLPRKEGGSFAAGDADLSLWLARVMRSAETRRNETYRIDLHLNGDTLWALPDRFKGRF